MSQTFLNRRLSSRENPSQTRWIQGLTQYMGPSHRDTVWNDIIEAHLLYYEGFVAWSMSEKIVFQNTQSAVAQDVKDSGTDRTECSGSKGFCSLTQSPKAGQSSISRPFDQECPSEPIGWETLVANLRSCQSMTAPQSESTELNLLEVGSRLPHCFSPFLRSLQTAGKGTAWRI